MPASPSPKEVLAAVRASPGNRVKVAVVDIDGILRGKYIHKEKFVSAIEGGFGFCDVVYGWDSHDQCYDNTTLTGWHKGFPDVVARLDLATHRNVPWDDGVDFFLGNCVRTNAKGREEPFPLDPRQVLKRVLARADKLGLAPMCSLEFEFFNFAETPHSWAEKQGVGPEPITPGMFGYSLLRANHAKDYFKALFNECGAFGVPIEGLHTETGPGVYEAAIIYCEALEAADRGVLFKQSAKEIGSRFGIMPSFMAKWSQQYPGCSGHVHQSLSDGKKNVFYDAKGRGGMSKVFESYLAGPARHAARVRADVLADDQQLQAPRRRLLGTGEADVGHRQPHGELPRHSRLVEVDAARDALPGSRRQLVSGLAACVAAGLYGIENKLKLTAPPIHGTNLGAEDIPRAPRTLIETTQIFKASERARDWFGDEFVDHFAATREWEWRQWQDAVTDWERKRYFEII